MSHLRDQPDEVLYVMSGRGDEEAFRCLVERYMNLVVGYFVHRVGGGGQQAEDLAQDVFFKLWRHAARYSVKAKFSTYLYSVAHNTLVDFMRRKGTRFEEVSVDDEKERDLIAETADSGVPEPLEKLALDEQISLLKQALAKLRLPEREALLLVLADGLSYKEVSEILGIPEGTVKSRLHAALARLRKFLSLENRG
jgi:RNA polymerase sigma-70 factor (ECF subfamily)